MSQEFDKKFASSIDLGKKELKNVIIHKLPNDLNNPEEGQIWYNKTEDSVKFFNGTTKYSIATATDLYNELGADLTPVVRTNNPTVATNTINANISELDNAIGTSPTPVVRTNGPIAAANSVNTNIDALDAAIGADNTPVVRTYSPTVANTTINTKIQVLDTAIGVDPTPAGTRTAGTIATSNSVNANIDALDAAIGFEAQISGTPNVVTKTGTVFQMIDQLDAYKSVQTIKKTIGGIGVTADFNFATAEDQVEQVIDLGEIIPAKAKIFNALVFTDDEFTGAVSLSCTLGNSSSGDELVAATDLIAANAIGEQATGGLTPLATSASAQNIYLSATPGANWSNVTAGKLSVYVTFINVTNI